MTLSELLPGESARITGDTLPETPRRRVRGLGVLPGVQVTCLYTHPEKDPRAYLIGETVIAMRLVTAAQIQIQK